MGTIKREPDVLKLVRAGRRVELHKEPITAAEVLRRYPRHSITRTDIFENPWIVVKPEALLTPGRVFFIVPNRTIYQLLKAKEGSDHNESPSSSQQRESPKDHAHPRLSVSENTSSPNKADAGMTPMHKAYRRKLKNQFFSLSCSTSTTVCPSSEGEEGSDKELQRDYRGRSGPVLVSKHRTSQGERRRKSSISSRNETRKGKESITEELGDLKFTYSNQVIPLKSCLRKRGTARRLLRLRVSFLLPEDYVERQTKARNCRMKYPDFKY